MKPFPWKCESCGHREVYSETLGEYTTSMDHDGRPYEVRVTNLDVVRCRGCGFVALPNPALRRLSDRLREVVGLMRPEEIRTRRERLGLTQKEMAHYLQVAEGTLSRWETGAQIQQRCMDKLLLGFFEVEEFRRLLGVPSQHGAQVIPPITGMTAESQTELKKANVIAWTYVHSRTSVTKNSSETGQMTLPPPPAMRLVG